MNTVAGNEMLVLDAAKRYPNASFLTLVDQPGLPLPRGGPIRKIYVDGVGARILDERVEYLDENGKLVTESLRDFTKTALKKRFAWHKSSRGVQTRTSP